MNPVIPSLLPNTVRRDQWKALPPKVIDFGVEHPVTSILFTYTETDTCSTKEECTKIIQDLQLEHMATLPDIKPNFLIGGDGNLYVGRGWVSNPELPPHHKGKLNSMLYFAYVGRKGKLVPENMKQIGTDLILLGYKNEYIIQTPQVCEEVLL